MQLEDMWLNKHVYLFVLRY